MKVVILAGGLGTRISEQTYNKPKPMIKIGNMPIIWHIMKIYSKYGYNDFVICGGYKIEVIKKFFTQIKSNVNFIYNNKLSKNPKKKNFKWNVHLVNTGIKTNTVTEY